MSAILKAIPDVEVFLSLEPEELGAKLLFIARPFGMFSLNVFEHEIWDADSRGLPSYPRNRKDAVALALAEAWTWLEAQGLITPAPSQGHGTSYRVLSRRARRFQSEAEFANWGRLTSPLCPGRLSSARGVHVMVTNVGAGFWWIADGPHTARHRQDDIRGDYPRAVERVIPA